MPIDASILNNIKPVQFDSAGIVNMLQQGQALRMQKERQAQQMQLGQQQLQEGAIGLQEKQRQVTEGGQLRQLFQQSPDLRTALPGVFKINPTMGIAMQKSLHEQEKSELDIQKTGIEVKAKQAERFGSIAGTIKDEGSFHQGITTALAEGLIKSDDAAKLLAQGWDNPQTQALVQQITQGAIGAKEQHDMGIADIKAKQDALASQHAAELQPFKLAKAESDAAAGNRESDAVTLAAAAKQGPDALMMGLQRLSDAGRVEPFMGIGSKSKPEDILRIGMKPEQVASADIQAKNAENNVTEYELELRAAKGDQNARAALAASTARKAQVAAAGGAATRGLDREVNQYGKPFDEIAKGADGQLDKILDAEKMIAGGAIEQALGVPKILTALVSGQGSGVRITQAELASITKARGIGGDVEGFFNRISGQGTLTAAQKQQMQSILQDVRERIVQKKMIARTVTDEMQTATSREGVLAAAKKGRDGLDAHAAQGGARSGGTIRYTSGSTVYNIPASQEAEFLKDHPGATK